MADLSFITDEVLRDMIARDMNELTLCMQHNLDKSALILAGSIIETVLVDYFLAFPPPNNKNEDQIKKADLSDLIDWAADKDVGLISSSTKGITTVIRMYRNLIHPGVEYRLQISVDKNKATVATSLVEIVMDEIRRNYAQKLGYTANQAINKILVDTSSITIFHHMINNMSIIERIKLFRQIPTLNMLPEYSEEDILLGDTPFGPELRMLKNERLKAFVNLHGLLKSSIPIDIQITEVEKIFDCVSNKSREATIHYMLFFYNNLDLLGNDKRSAVIDYLLAMFINGSVSELNDLRKWNICSGIGKFLDDYESINLLADALVKRLRNPTRPNDTGDNILLDILASDIIYSLKNDVWKKLLASLREHISPMNKRSTNWIDKLEEQYGIPF